MQIWNKNLTLCLKASHFLFQRDCLEGRITMSVLVLLSPFGEEDGSYCRCFLLLGLPFNSSFTTSYPFFAKSMNFASLILWKADETFEEEMVDLNLPNNVSAESLSPDCWLLCSPLESLVSSFASAPFSAEVPTDSEDSSLLIPKVPLT